MIKASSHHEYWEPHFIRIETILKGQPFWKTALFNLMCLQRQWPVYERLSVGREWGNAKAAAKALDRFWKAVSTGYSMGDSYRAMVDDSAVVVTEDWDVLASEFIVTLQWLFELFEMKDKKAFLQIAIRNVEFLDTFLDFEAAGDSGIHPLMEQEQEFQLHLAEAIGVVQTAGKIDFIKTCHEAQPLSILGSFWFQGYPDYQPLKKRRSQPAGDGLRFRTAHQTGCLGSKDWQLVRESRQKLFMELEAYRSSGYCDEGFLEEKEEKKTWNKAKILIKHFSQQNYLPFYSKLCSEYNHLAEDSYLSGKPMEQTLQAIYQAARCAIISCQLYDSIPEKERRVKKLKRPFWGFAMEAELQAMLIYSYEEAANCMDGNTSPYSRLIYHMLLGQYTEAGHFLEACRTEADPIYRGADFKLTEALCAQNADDIRKSIVQMLRAIRRVEDLYRQVFPSYLILAVRCVKLMGIEIKKIDVSELPEELIRIDSPFDASGSQPFGI